MSKIIKLTEEYLEKLKADFAKALSSMKLTDGKVQFTSNVGTLEDVRANLYFEETAYTKMRLLVDKFDSEVAWHGVAKRYDDGKNKYAYIIEDILVYPQEVASATVNTDQEKYQTWLMDLDDDTFNNLRMQGHSHVNMGTSPSSVDITHQEKILEQLDNSMFYIFLIWNKKNERTIKIYDLESNVLFDTKDVDVYTIDDGIGIIDFLNDADEKVSKKTYTPTTYASSLYSTYGSSKSESKDNAGSYKSKLQSKYNYDDDDDDDWWKNGYAWGYNR